MDFRCLWHSPAYIPKGKQGLKVCKQVDILLCPMKWKKQQRVEREDHCTFLLTFWLTTLVDRPMTSALHRSEYFTTFTGIRCLIPGFERWDSLWMRLGFGKLKDSQTPWTLWKDAESLIDKAFERQRDFINSSLTSSIQITHIAYQLTVAPAWCVQWRDLTYIMTRDWREQTLVTKRTHLLYTVVYSWLDTLQQVGFDDERQFFRVSWNLLIRHWWHWWLKKYWKTLKIFQKVTDDFPWTDQHNGRNWRKNWVFLPIWTLAWDSHLENYHHTL